MRSLAASERSHRWPSCGPGGDARFRPAWKSCSTTKACRTAVIYRFSKPSLGSWTRVKLLTSNSKELPWDDDCEAQFPLAVRELLRLVERCDRPLFAAPCPPDNDKKHVDLLLPLAVAASKSKQNRWLMETVLPPRKAKHAASRLFGRRARKVKLPPPAHRSEWAQTAILQPDWKRSSPRLVVAYANHEVRLDFTIGRDSVFAGTWDFEVSVDGAGKADR